MGYTDEYADDEDVCEIECPHECRCDQDSCICVCDCEEKHEAEHLAQDSFLLHMTQYDVWSDPMQGAVSSRPGRVFPLLQPHRARTRALGTLAAH